MVGTVNGRHSHDRPEFEFVDVLALVTVMLQFKSTGTRTLPVLQ